MATATPTRRPIPGGTGSTPPANRSRVSPLKPSGILIAPMDTHSALVVFAAGVMSGWGALAIFSVIAASYFKGRG